MRGPSFARAIGADLSIARFRRIDVHIRFSTGTL
jgi:hypothetical protein